MRLFQDNAVARMGVGLPLSWHLSIEGLTSEQYDSFSIFFFAMFLPIFLMVIFQREGFYKYALVFLGLPLAIDAFVIYIANIFFLFYIFKTFTYWFITKRFLDYIDYCSDKYEKTPRFFDL